MEKLIEIKNEHKNFKHFFHYTSSILNVFHFFNFYNEMFKIGFVENDSQINYFPENRNLVYILSYAYNFSFFLLFGIKIGAAFSVLVLVLSQNIYSLK